jgi:hypothetical protein
MLSAPGVVPDPRRFSAPIVFSAPGVVPDPRRFAAPSVLSAPGVVPDPRRFSAPSITPAPSIASAQAAAVGAAVRCDNRPAWTTRPDVSRVPAHAPERATVDAPQGDNQDGIEPERGSHVGTELRTRSRSPSEEHIRSKYTRGGNGSPADSDCRARSRQYTRRPSNRAAKAKQAPPWERHVAPARPTALFPGSQQAPSYVLGAEDHMCWGKAAIIRELEAPTPLSRKLALALAACPTFGQMVRQALRGTSGALAGIWPKDAAAEPHRCHCWSICRSERRNVGE